MSCTSRISHQHDSIKPNICHEWIETQNVKERNTANCGGATPPTNRKQKTNINWTRIEFTDWLAKLAVVCHTHHAQFRLHEQVSESERATCSTMCAMTHTRQMLIPKLWTKFHSGFGECAWKGTAHGFEAVNNNCAVCHVRYIIRRWTDHNAMYVCTCSD